MSLLIAGCVVCPVCAVEGWRGGPVEEVEQDDEGEAML